MAVAEPHVAEIPRRFGGTERVSGVWRQSSTSNKVALATLALVCVLATVGPLLAPYDPLRPSGSLLAPPSATHVFGTDEIGRDIFSRVLHGVAATWWSAVAVIASGIVIGGVLGVVAGTRGGWIDAVIMRVTDLFLALPGGILAIAVVAALGPSLVNTLIAVAIVWWPLYARIVRSEVRALAVRPHLEAAKLAGVHPVRRAVRHLFPGALPVIVVAASLDIGVMILMLASLSFLGLGQLPPAPELGAMVAHGLTYQLGQWWVPVLPGATIMVLALVANVGGDAIRDTLKER